MSLATCEVGLASVFMGGGLYATVTLIFPRRTRAHLLGRRGVGSNPIDPTKELCAPWSTVNAPFVSGAIRTHTLSRAFPNPTSLHRLAQAEEIPVDGRACKPVRDGARHGRSCKRAWPLRAATVWPSHREQSSGSSNRSELQPTSRNSVRHSRPAPDSPASAYPGCGQAGQAPSGGVP